MIFTNNNLISDRYKVKTYLSSGGFGNVYLVEDMSLSSHSNELLCCLKFQNTKIGSFFLNDYAVKSEFLIGNLLSHQNFVKVRHLDYHNNYPYILMEYINGLNLKELVINDRTFCRNLFVTSFLNACRYMHDKHVIHSDIKPTNILITKDNKLKIIDFGMSFIKQENYNTSKSKNDFLIFNGMFTAPEIYERSHYTYESDTYAICMVIFFMLSKNPKQFKFSGFYDTQKNEKFLLNMDTVKADSYFMKLLFKGISNQTKLRTGVIAELCDYSFKKKGMIFNCRSNQIHYDKKIKLFLKGLIKDIF